ncbi:MAG: aminodeoxychorismate synthase component I [Candidatus Altiarchaeales archaeon]|nr:aminodeoxychorismate synthase component I [Candidatus Altiarchaeales archaeon]
MFVKELPWIDPAAAYKALYRGESVLLESQKNGVYSYIALNPYMKIKSKGSRIQVEGEGGSRVLFGDPLKVLEKIISERRVDRETGWPLFYSGAIGYFSYDLAHTIHGLGRSAVDDVDLADMYLIFPSDVVSFNHLSRKTTVFSQTRGGLSEIEGVLEGAGEVEMPKPGCTMSFTSNFTWGEYREAVEKCKKHVSEGDAYQIKLSQRFMCELSEDPLNIYLRLRSINPSPYAAFLCLEGHWLVSCSPEHLVKVEGGRVETRPIGGTYPRGVNKQVDERLAREFMADEKERAEHTMLIDLERNDLGRVCEYGSVEVDEFMCLERYSHLTHIVTNIRGRLRGGENVFTVFRSMFPGGTITGCPKIRSMQIIDEVEPNARGPYTGSIGFINFSGEMDLNIIIRTLIIKEDKGMIQVGGGVVADSNARREYDETFEKAYALFEALGGRRK